jgi:hypothetical protein
MFFHVLWGARVCRQVVGVAAAIATASLLMSTPAAAQSTSTWTTCAKEGGLCSFTGTREVRYGANSTWTVRQIAASGGGVQCWNGVFGDPVPGVVKSCQLKATTETVPTPTPTPTPTGWTFCSNEYAKCSFSGTRRVRYGADTRWVARDLVASNGGVSCSNGVFGDPAPNTVKRCELAVITVTTQQPPTISGSPATSVTVGNSYRFQPSASDPDSSTLAFSISNRPSWATFNTTNGVLTGQPTLGNVGTTSNIVISVSDGTTSVALPAFAINVVQNSSGTATLSWVPPTQNTNGTALSNLAGYRVYYGTSANTLTQQIQVPNPGISSYVVSGLASATYYFEVRAYNSAGTESASSNRVTKTIP